MKNTEYIKNNLISLAVCLFSLMILCGFVQEVKAEEMGATAKEVKGILDDVASELDYDLSKKNITINVDDPGNEELPTTVTKPVFGDPKQANIVVNKANWDKKNDLAKTILLAHELERGVTVSDTNSDVNKAFTNKIDAREQYIKARIDNEPKVDLLRKQTNYYESKLDYLNKLKQDEINAYYKYSESHRVKLGAVKGLPDDIKRDLDRKVIKDKVKTTQRIDNKIDNTKINYDNSRKDLVSELESMRSEEDKKLTELNRLHRLRQVSEQNYAKNSGEIKSKIALLDKEIGENS